MNKGSLGNQRLLSKTYKILKKKKNIKKINNANPKLVNASVQYYM